MKLRLVSAAVGIPLLIVVLWLGTAAVAVLALVAAAAGGWEIAGMARSRTRRSAGWLAVAWPVGVVAAGWLIANDSVSWWLLGVAVAAGLVPALAVFLSGRRVAGIYGALAGIYIGLTLAHAPVIRSLDDGAGWLLVALLGTFAVDSAAMLTGVAIGRHRMAPRISPAKTWEGAAGALVAGAIAIPLLDIALDLDIALLAAAALGSTMAVAAIIGDIGESALKRHAGVKDSGILVPGHGGILDRLDSLIPNLVIVYWAAVWSAS